MKAALLGATFLIDFKYFEKFKMSGPSVPQWYDFLWKLICHDLKLKCTYEPSTLANHNGG